MNASPPLANLITLGAGVTLPPPIAQLLPRARMAPDHGRRRVRGLRTPRHRARPVPPRQASPGDGNAEPEPSTGGYPLHHRGAGGQAAEEVDRLTEQMRRRPGARVRTKNPSTRSSSQDAPPTSATQKATTREIAWPETCRGVFAERVRHRSGTWASRGAAADDRRSQVGRSGLIAVGLSPPVDDDGPVLHDGEDVIGGFGEHGEVGDRVAVEKHRSARVPGRSRPISPLMSSRSAATTVADLMTSAGAWT